MANVLLFCHLIVVILSYRLKLSVYDHFSLNEKTEVLNYFGIFKIFGIVIVVFFSVIIIINQLEIELGVWFKIALITVLVVYIAASQVIFNNKGIKPGNVKNFIAGQLRLSQIMILLLIVRIVID